MISLTNFCYPPYHAQSNNNSDETRSGQHVKVTSLSQTHELWTRKNDRAVLTGRGEVLVPIHQEVPLEPLNRRFRRWRDANLTFFPSFFVEKDANLTSSSGRSLCTNFFCNEITDFDRNLEEELTNSGLLDWAAARVRRRRTPMAMVVPFRFCLGTQVLCSHRSDGPSWTSVEGRRRKG